MRIRSKVIILPIRSQRYGAQRSTSRAVPGCPGSFARGVGGFPEVGDGRILETRQQVGEICGMVAGLGVYVLHVRYLAVSRR